MSVKPPEEEKGIFKRKKTTEPVMVFSFSAEEVAGRSWILTKLKMTETTFQIQPVKMMWLVSGTKKTLLEFPLDRSNGTQAGTCTRRLTARRPD